MWTRNTYFPTGNYMFKVKIETEEGVKYIQS